MKRNRKRRKISKIILLVIIIVIFYCVVINMDIIKGKNSMNTYSIESTIHAKSSSYKYAIYKNQVVIFENNLLKFNDGENENTYTFQQDISEPVMKSIGEAIFMTDRANGNIYVFDEKGAIINYISLNKEIISVKADINKKYIGFHTRESNGIEQLIFFDGEGKKTGEIYGVEDGKIIDFSFDATRKMVAISAMTYEDSLKTNILIVDINGNIQSGLVINNEIYPKIFLTEDENIICVGDSKVIKLNDDKEILWQRDIKADDAEYSSQGLIITKSEIGRTEIYIIDDDNNIILETESSDNIEKIICTNNKTALYGKGTLYEINNGILKETKISNDIIWADILMNGKIVIGNNRKVEIITTK